MKLQKLLSYTRKACEDYNMIEDGDVIGVGVSGGKDSLALLMALNDLKRFYPKKFEVIGITVSLGFDGFDTFAVEELCKKINCPYHVVTTDIGEIIFETRKEGNPCSLCSKMRKGALNEGAKKLGCNKIALGHNKDDVIETFFLSLFYEGRVHTFAPVTYLDRMDLTVIRPIMYVPEIDIIGFKNKNNIITVKNPCPVDGHTKREQIKNFIATQSKDYDHLSDKVFGAIKRSDINGWNSSN